MLAIWLIAACAWTLAATSAVDAAAVDVDDPHIALPKRWEAYKALFDKNYTTTSESMRFEIFTAHDITIQAHNAQNFSWILGHNTFSDLTPDEFDDVHLCHIDLNLGGQKHYDPDLGKNTSLPKALDWVAKGAVTAVKNQEQCGSCWAFSAIGAIEGAFEIGGSPLTHFSEQDLVSCDNTAHGGQDDGCSGGLMDHAFSWIENNGICLERDYPYTSGTGRTGQCETKCKPAARIDGYFDVQDETKMLAAIGVGPVSVAIEADRSVFQLYKKGVLDSTACGKQLDHGVLAVGYGTDGDKDYYKVKNSWGPLWGEGGYIRIVRNKDMCGIADAASYPTGVRPVGPAPPSPGPQPHYEDPHPRGCRKDELITTLPSLEGDFCAPHCTGGRLHPECPRDLPQGVTAVPACVLEDRSGGGKRCALICHPGRDGECGRATCKGVPGGPLGICTYDG